MTEGSAERPENESEEMIRPTNRPLVQARENFTHAIENGWNFVGRNSGKIISLSAAGFGISLGIGVAYQSEPAMAAVFCCAGAAVLTSLTQAK